ncbi:threonine-phosphate decarboxylase CobD [Lysobacter sp. Root690]|uniref:threonine-phosphate decarboxylase CobD n=1 Tax=Lysobacter sp. Root690 TaxID=1736588 RepID=UPI0006FAC4FC|nr:threonine-phosphate decarboxylase CobD [Lysobacter sp. Root690]KRB10929.1 threonine-phosphate decarboxylase [Lysobacter sp. Root690]
MLEHGGRLLRAARQYGIAVQDWLDLSTGINPVAWPVPEIPARAWHRLPEDDDGLIDVARAYYGAESLWPVAGSQAAIQALPELRAASTVGVLAPGYAEHAQAWRRCGHLVELRGAAELIAQADDFDVIVLIHPNNPGGERFERAALLDLHARLAARGGWLLIDEAFMDATPELSLCGESAREGLIVLRSVGKFFGLAGARAGFVCANEVLLQALRERLGPWTVTGPTRHALRHALTDREWQATMRAQLLAQGERLAALLSAHGLRASGGCAFFQWHRNDEALALHEALARCGVFTRYFEQPRSLRFGLPDDEAQWRRLDTALADVMHERTQP